MGFTSRCHFARRYLPQYGEQPQKSPTTGCEANAGQPATGAYEQAQIPVAKRFMLDKH